MGTNFCHFGQKPQKVRKLIPAKISTTKVDAIMTAKSEMETISDKYPELKTLDVNFVELVGGESQADIAILPAYPAMFKIASLRGIEIIQFYYKLNQVTFPQQHPEMSVQSM